MMTLWMVVIDEASDLNAMKYVIMRDEKLSKVSRGLSSAAIRSVLEHLTWKLKKLGRRRVLGDSCASRSPSSVCISEKKIL